MKQFLTLTLAIVMALLVGQLMRAREAPEKTPAEIVSRLEGLAEKEDPQKTYAERIAAASQRIAEKRVDQGGVDGKRAAAESLLGFISYNATYRGGFCKKQGVGLDGLILALERSHSLELKVASELLGLDQKNRYESFARFSTEMNGILEKEMIELSLTKGLAMRELCLLFEEQAIYLSEEVHFSKVYPKIWSALMGKQIPPHDPGLQ